MSNFLEAIQAGIDAANTKLDNLQIIANVIFEATKDIEEFSSSVLTLESRVSAMDALHSYAAKLAVPQHNKLKPLNEVLYVQLKDQQHRSEELTMLFMGAKGFPCTIYVEGNQLTAGDESAFRENIQSLLAAPSTGEKIAKLLKEAKE